MGRVVFHFVVSLLELKLPHKLPTAGNKFPTDGGPNADALAPTGAGESNPGGGGTTSAGLAKNGEAKSDDEKSDDEADPATDELA